MATRVTETIYDDLDESTDDVRTVTLSLDGQAVEVDLSAKNYEKLSKAVAPYLEAGRKASGSTGPTRRRRGSASAPAKSTDTAAVRAWAAENGIEISSRGRVSADVLAKYQAAQG